MTLRLKILPRAEYDAQYIFNYLLERSPKGAAAWWASFEEAAARAVKNVAQFGLAPEDEMVPVELRQVLFKTHQGHTYRFVFTVSSDELRILRVRGSGQPPLRSDEIRAD